MIAGVHARGRALEKCFDRYGFLEVKNQTKNIVGKGRKNDGEKKIKKQGRDAGKTKREAVFLKSKRELRCAIILACSTRSIY